MQASEINAKIEASEEYAAYSDESTWFSPSIGGFMDWESLKTVSKILDAPIEEVYRRGGEDQGSEYFVVYLIDGEYFRIDGYYTSYEGTEWDDEGFRKAIAREVLVTRWDFYDE